jgi:hypothetical protein
MWPNLDIFILDKSGHILLYKSDFPKTVGPSVLTDRNAVGPTISKYISDQMSGKTQIFERTGD